MSLYAYDEDLLLYAVEAEPKKVYRCAGCSGHVRVRKGFARLPHFYHLSSAPSCRLYSKSEDHLLLQVALQKMLPGEIILEKPFPQISRIADVAWEPHKIIFEIQCSLLSIKEAQQRMVDYKSLGYQVVWILDDRIFNRRSLRPAESYLRQHPCYYVSMRKEGPTFYDQFEILDGKRRVKRGHSLKIEIDKPFLLSNQSWTKEKFPSQILQKKSNLYFKGDLIHRALLPENAFSMQNFSAQERLFASSVKRESILKKIVTKIILEPFGKLLLFLLKDS